MKVKRVWCLLLALTCGLVTGLAAYLAYTSGLEHMEPSRAAQLATIEPVSAALLGVILFRQTLSLTETLGVVLVVGAVVLMNTGRPKEKDLPGAERF